MTAESQETIKTSTEARTILSNRTLLLVIAASLVVLVALSATVLGVMLQQQSDRADYSAQIDRLVIQYENAAYDNPQVDTIYQQQLIATEHVLMALQIIASQNAH